MKMNSRVVFVIMVLTSLGAVAQSHTLFILDFKNQTNLNDVSLGPGIAAMFTTALIESGSFRIVERGEVLKAVMKEQALSLSGAMDDKSQAIRIGQLVGANALVTGTVTEFGIRKTSASAGALIGFAGKKTVTARVVIDVRLVDISTASVKAAAAATGESSTEMVAGAALPFTLEFGAQGFDQTLVGQAVRKAVTQAAISLAKQAGSEPPQSVQRADEPTGTAVPETVVSTTSTEEAAPQQSTSFESVSYEGNGDLYITSVPSGASVQIDSKPVKGTTPVTIQGFPAGFHKIDMSKDQMTGSSTITLKTDDLLKVHVALRAGNGSLKVFSEPAEAAVYIDGVEKGRSPCKIDNVTAGERRITVMKNGFASYSDTVKVIKDEIKNLNVTLLKGAVVNTVSRMTQSSTLNTPAVTEAQHQDEIIEGTVPEKTDNRLTQHGIYNGHQRVISFGPFCYSFWLGYKPQLAGSWEFGFRQGHNYWGIMFKGIDAGDDLVGRWTSGDTTYTKYRENFFGGGGFRWSYETFWPNPYFSLSPGACLGFWYGEMYEFTDWKTSSRTRTFDNYHRAKKYFEFAGLTLEAKLGYKYVFLYSCYTFFIGSRVVNTVETGLQFCF